MRCSVYVDRDVLASLDDEATALAFIREQFDQELIVNEVWLEIVTDSEAEILQGEQLLRRVRAARPSGRLSA
jgi:hypothetical protein